MAVFSDVVASVVQRHGDHADPQDMEPAANTPLLSPEEFAEALLIALREEDWTDEGVREIAVWLLALAGDWTFRSIGFRCAMDAD